MNTSITNEKRKMTDDSPKGKQKKAKPVVQNPLHLDDLLTNILPYLLREKTGNTPQVSLVPVICKQFQRLYQQMELQRFAAFTKEGAVFILSCLLPQMIKDGHIAVLRFELRCIRNEGNNDDAEEDDSYNFFVYVKRTNSQDCSYSLTSACSVEDAIGNDYLRALESLFNLHPDQTDGGYLSDWSTLQQFLYAVFKEIPMKFTDTQSDGAHNEDLITFRLDMDNFRLAFCLSEETVETVSKLSPASPSSVLLFGSECETFEDDEPNGHPSSLESIVEKNECLWLEPHSNVFRHASDSTLIELKNMCEPFLCGRKLW